MRNLVPPFMLYGDHNNKMKSFFSSCLHIVRSNTSCSIHKMKSFFYSCLHNVRSNTSCSIHKMKSFFYSCLHNVRSNTSCSIHKIKSFFYSCLHNVRSNICCSIKIFVKSLFPFLYLMNKIDHNLIMSMLKHFISPFNNLIL